MVGTGYRSFGWLGIGCAVPFDPIRDHTLRSPLLLGNIPLSVDAGVFLGSLVKDLKADRGEGE
jgi:hypothetical protein